MHQVLTDRSITTRDLASSFYALGFFYKNLSATEIYAQLEGSEIGRIQYLTPSLVFDPIPLFKKFWKYLEQKFSQRTGNVFTQRIITREEFDRCVLQEEVDGVRYQQAVQNITAYG